MSSIFKINLSNLKSRSNGFVQKTINVKTKEIVRNRVLSWLSEKSIILSAVKENGRDDKH